MLKSIKNPLKVALCVIGTLIGAGFASGQEIHSFFIIYGKKSVFGLVIFAALLAVYLTSVLGTANDKSVHGYKDYLCLIMPQKLSSFVELTVTLFSLASFCIMVSGTGTLLKQIFGIHTLWGAVLMSAVCFFIFSKNAKGVVNANALLTPVIIVFITLMGISAVFSDLNTGAFSPLGKITDNFVFSAFIYVSYNTLSLTPVLIELKDYVKSKKDVRLAMIFSASFLGIMAGFIWYALIKFENTIVYDEIPMLDIAAFFGGVYKYAYPIVLFAAMLTTAVSSGFGFVCNMSKISRLPPKKISMALCVLAVPLSQFGFAALISNLYTFFGYLGIAVFVLSTAKYFLKK